jgi:hypothetical protein
MKEHKPGDGTPQEPKWAFFTLLSFLDVHLKLKEYVTADAPGM